MFFVLFCFVLFVSLFGGCFFFHIVLFLICSGLFFFSFVCFCLFFGGRGLQGVMLRVNSKLT